MDTPDWTQRDRSGSSSASLAERRREQRFACRRPIELLGCAGDVSWSSLKAEMIDCSAHGIGIVVGRPLQAGEQFMVKVRLSTTAVVLYTVRNCRKSEEGYRIGAEFVGYVVAGGDVSRESIADALMNSRH